MKKLLIIASFIIILIGIWAGIFLYTPLFQKINPQEIPHPSTLNNHSQSWSTSKQIHTEKTAEEKVQEKIQRIKERLALKGLILNGDTYFKKGKNTLALKNYLRYYKKNPSDPLILTKLWDTYFSMHKYVSALNYYAKLPTVHSNHIRSLFYSSDFSNINEFQKLIGTIEKLDISKEEKFYLTNSAKCSQDFHTCKIHFAEYFESGSGQILHPPLQDIKTAIENYKNFHLDDVLLKNAYILWAWFSDKQYSLVAHIWEQILQERPDYKVILKLVAQSYFKLWSYEQARKYLWKYIAIDDSDPSVNYMLWRVNTHLREYILANIYFSKALKLWYKNKIEVQRAMIYNFSLLEDKENLLKQFKKLIETFDYDENDFSLAVYYHILYGDYDWPQKIFKSVNEKFPENSNIYAYKWWIERETGKLESAKKTLLLGEKLDQKNPFIFLSLAYTERELWNTGNALVYFKKTIATNPNSEFALQAQKEIDTHYHTSSWVLNNKK